jgi:HlyD family secretion protein
MTHAASEIVVAVGGDRAAATALSIWAFSPEPIPVDAAEVTRGPLTVTVDEEGMTRVRDRFVAAAPVTGRLDRIERREGDSVRRGEPRATIAPAPLDPRTRREAAARLEAALDAERRTRATVAQARSALEQAERERARFEALHRQNVVAAEARERAALAEETRRLDLDAADFQAQAAAHEAEQARAALSASPSDGGWERMVVRAPVAGRVLRIYEPSERVVAAGAPVAEIGNRGHLEVVVDLLSTDAVNVAPGDTMQLLGWGGPDTLLAVLERVEPSAFNKVSALGVEEQRVNVIGRLEQAPAALGDRYRVDVRIVVWQAADPVRVPRGALFRAAGEWRVFALEEGRARERRVRIGRQAVDWAEVIEGLGPGERVVLRPDDRIGDGTRVRAR